MLLILPSLYGFSQGEFSASGGLGEPYSYEKDLVGTRIKKVYLFNTLNGAKITYTSSSSSVTFYRYQQNANNKELVPSIDINQSSMGSETTYTVSNLLDGWGYYAEHSANVYSVAWVIDYSVHFPMINSIVAEESDDKCENLKLLIGKKENLPFYDPGGLKKEIDVDYKLTYNTLKWDDGEKKFLNYTESKDIKNLGTELIVTPPLKDTHFTLEDQIAVHFNMPNRKIESALYEAVATEAHITAQQDNESSDNNTADHVDIGGSAPVDVRFLGSGNEPVAYYYTWSIYNTKNPNNAIARYTDKEISSYRFEQSGDYKVVLEVADRTSFCADTTSITFKITESFLDQPNFFSPGDSPGSNDEFRVAYKSLIRFKCTIFNRWGVKLYEWTDPAKGWDGKYKGSYVKPGVYFYVIDAEGSDGIKYKRAGDINILRSR